MNRSVFTFAAATLVVAGSVLAGCGAAGTDENDPVGVAAEADTVACTVLCIQGYHLLPHSCACVPDHGHSCSVAGVCEAGYAWNENKCGCVPVQSGEPCGERLCPAGEVCCNASCGICTPPGYACIQIACASAL